MKVVHSAVSTPIYELAKICELDIQLGAPPRLSGDAIYLDLEREGKAIVYWTGKTYRGYGQ